MRANRSHANVATGCDHFVTVAIYQASQYINLARGQVISVAGYVFLFAKKSQYLPGYPRIHWRAALAYFCYRLHNPCGGSLFQKITCRAGLNRVKNLVAIIIGSQYEHIYVRIMAFYQCGSPNAVQTGHINVHQYNISGVLLQVQQYVIAIGVYAGDGKARRT